MKTNMFKPRSIPVRAGDVFTQGMRRLVVTGFDGARAVCIDIFGDAMRTTRIMTRRLQREYSRCGEVDTAAAHRKLAKAQAAKASGR